MGRCNYTLCPPLTVAMDVGWETEERTAAKRLCHLDFFGKIRKVKQQLKPTSKKKTFTMDSLMNNLTSLDDITVSLLLKLFGLL